MKFGILALAVLAMVTAGARFAFAGPKPVGSGVVVIETTLAYSNGQAAATGMVLTPSGEVLTNNHVVNGATTLVAYVPGTSHRYAARVVGYDVSRDVAVIQLQRASNLKTVSAGSAATLGQRVRAVGNAGGTGTLTSATGRVTGVGKTITASDDQGGSERLTGLIETDADVQAGDSGGPLFDLSGKVVGMDTAASRGGFGYQATSSADAYAIPIARALAIARQIEGGHSSATVHIGKTAFLGVQIEAAGGSGGVLIGGVVPGGPADSAGLVAGDVITGIAGRTIATPQGLQSFMRTQKPGAHVSVAFVDGYGSSATASVTLGSGPPQ